MVSCILLPLLFQNCDLPTFFLILHNYHNNIFHLLNFSIYKQNIASLNTLSRRAPSTTRTTLLPIHPGLYTRISFFKGLQKYAYNA